MDRRRRPMLRVAAAAAIAAVAMAGPARPAEEAIAPLGAGSYLLAPPPGGKAPPSKVYRGPGLDGPMPTSDWWSSLAWVPFSEPQYAHPLVLKAEPGGLRVFHAAAITANSVGIFGSMPGSGEDFVIGHTGVARFPEATVEEFSDFFVTAGFREGAKGMALTYGHGSPYVYALFDGGDPVLRFPSPPKVWPGGAEGPAIGVATGGKAYGLFGPAGCRWEGLGTANLACRLNGARHFSAAILPGLSRRADQALDLFQRHAHAHVTDSRVSWSYDERTAAVTARFEIETVAREGDERAALIALYPHQWLRTVDPVLEHTYPSVRGTMKLLRGTGFSTRMTFPGVLPALPVPDGVDRGALRRLLEAEAVSRAGPRDTYWEGKRIGLLATLIPIAEECGATEVRDRLAGELRGRLEGWFTALDGSGRAKAAGVFAWNRAWGALIGYPASYGSDVELNDHHFHYGYFLKGAAELARLDPAWGAAERWGGMVRLLVRDIASPDRADPLFPFLRTFDPYAGHSWASGKAGFADGNNGESSSEAMNAWTAIILFGQATGDRALRDLGIYLFTTELEAIESYWFDVEGRHRPAAYTPSVVTMVWGGKGVNETWFSANPGMVHGINWLPLHGGSLYLGRFPQYCNRNFEALLREGGGRLPAEWGDLAIMYRALDDTADAIRRYEASPGIRIEAGNSRANLYGWIHALGALGRVARGVTADHPLYAVFDVRGRRTHVAYNAGEKPLEVRFSDGAVARAPGRGFALKVEERR